MPSSDRGAPPGRTPGPAPVIEVVLPVFDEERRLEAGVRGLRRHLDDVVDVPTLVTIADNGSTDATPAIGATLVDELTGVRMVRLEEKGRGRALRAVWSASLAPVVAYMDIDLSTGLDAFGPLVGPLIDGTADLMVGTRLAPGSTVDRGLRREVLSRGYNRLLHLILGSGVSDAQCGFKAVRRPVIRELLPLVADNGWFFDTELLVAADRRGFRIGEVPVTWVENTDSRVRLVKTALRDLQGIARLARHPVPRWDVGVVRAEARPRIPDATPTAPGVGAAE